MHGWISISFAILEKLDSAKALSTAILLRYGEYDQIALNSIDPRDYNCPDLFFRDNQAVCLLKKARFLPTSFNTKRAGIAAFQEAEILCSNTNERFWNLVWGPDEEPCAKELDRARRQIARILGPAPNVHDLSWTYGKGSTSQVRFNHRPEQKYALVVDATLELQKYLINAMREGTDQIEYLMAAKAIDRIDTVPKTAVTDRPIGVPVHLNAAVQRGIGLYISDRISRFTKVKLENTPIYHHYLAQRAYDDGLATIDLKSASDTVSFALVRYMLPDDWFELLYACRVHSYELDGVIRPYSKFSAMGNGYTFELETLIFFALAKAVSGRSLVSVFGDDIIVEQQHYERLITILNFCGFEVNSSKSFSRSPFYESCGADFFQGIPVRAFYWKRFDDIVALNRLANAITTLAMRSVSILNPHYRSKTWLPVFKKVIKLVRRKGRVLYGPYEMGDSVIWAPFDQVKPSLKRPRRGWQGYMLKAWRKQPWKYKPSAELAYRYALSAGRIPSSYNRRNQIMLSKRDEVASYAESTSICFTYTGPGSWV